MRYGKKYPIPKTKSKDKKIRNEGRNFVEVMQKKDKYVLNGKTSGDWDGEYTYVGARGCTVIDLQM